MRDVVKIATGVFLGLLAFGIVTTVFAQLIPPSADERAARELLERQFAPAR